MPQRRLLSHLAQFGSFGRQGEVLCTQGLLYLLENTDATASLARLLSNRLQGASAAPGVHLPIDRLHWVAEATQEDRGRPDLEGRSEDGTPRIKIEAKLGAPLGSGQLRSYVDHFASKSCDGIVVVLVPSRRLAEVRRATVGELACGGADPWCIGTGPKCVVTVVSWEDALEALSAVTGEPFVGDLANFAAMYRVLIGDSLEPIRSAEELVAWRDTETKYIGLVTKVSERLTTGKMLPLGRDIRNDPGSYFRRYVCLDGTCFSIGLRSPFPGHTTPVWMRFHSGTRGFNAVRAKLVNSDLAECVLHDGGHLWIPLEVPLNEHTDGMVAAVLDQARRVLEVAGMPVERGN
jgi:hypothetical protein